MNDVRRNPPRNIGAGSRAGSGTYETKAHIRFSLSLLRLRLKWVKPGICLVGGEKTAEDMPPRSHSHHMSGTDAVITLRPSGTEGNKKSVEVSLGAPGRVEEVDMGLDRQSETSRPSLMVIQHLPTDVIGIIIQNHAILEWWGPGIDSAVCRLWRQTALGHPAVWSHVNIRPTHSNPIPSPSTPRRWLDRAQAAPLTIRIIGVDEQIVSDLLPVVLKKHESIAELYIAEFGAGINGIHFPSFTISELS